MKKIRIVSILSVLLALTTVTILPAQDAPPPTAADQKKDAENLANIEAIQREAKLQEAKKRHAEGLDLRDKNKLGEALIVLQKALDAVPAGMKADPEAIAIKTDMADIYARRADDAGNANMGRPIRDREWDGPIKDVQKALELSPNDNEIKQLLQDLVHERDFPSPIQIRRTYRPDMVPTKVEQRAMLYEKLKDARIQIEANMIDEAEVNLREVIKEDPYNFTAYRLLQRVQEDRIKRDEARYNVSHHRYIEEVWRKWWIEKPEKLTKPLATATTITSSSRTEEVMRKLNTIEIKQIDFQNAEIQVVIDFLSNESVRYDPEGKGVNFVVREIPANKVIRSLRLRAVKLIDVLKVITDLMDMRFVVEANAVVIVPKASPYGTQMETRAYPVDPSLILRIMNNAPAPGAGIPGPGAGPDLGGGPLAPGAGGGGAGMINIDSRTLMTFLEGLGVPFPPGSNATYLANLSRLVITNTVPNLETLERLLNDLNIGQFQAEIEIKFLEVSESDLKELGFNWFLGQFNLSRRAGADGVPQNVLVGNPNPSAFPPTVIPPDRITHDVTTTPQGTVTVTTSGQGSIEVGGNPFVSGQTTAFTGGLRDLSNVSIGAIESLLGGAASVVNDQILSFAGVLTNPQFEVIIKALSRHQKSDLLSAPRVTTILGQPATIKIVTEFIYPTRFREPQAVAANGGGTAGGNAAVAVTPSTPTAFATREIGVLLTVTPVLGADGHTINLSLNPEVSEFLGFINYGGQIQVPAPGSAQGFVTVDNKITQPIFATRSILTNVAIWDGSTVVLGGLAREDITEINDKVPLFGDIPLLGRFFRSKGKSVGKRNLIIFVTATLIDPAGNRVHPEGTVVGPFIQNPGGPDAGAPGVPPRP